MTTQLYDASIRLSELLKTDKVLFLRTEPEVLDFTDRALSKVVIYGSNNKVEIDVFADNIAAIIGILDATIFDKDVCSRFYCWDLKSLASYCRFHTAKFITPRSSPVDLKPIESFLGIKKPAPESLREAISRASVVSQNKDWSAIYKSIHLPLSLRVLPSIEATALLNKETRRSEHPYYEIEGQIGGRLNCSKKFSRSYLPHNMSVDLRKSLKPRGYGLRFATADYRFCEVVVLQWLTGDLKLKEIIDSGDDLHNKIYEIITGNSCDTDIKRRISKKMFLPVVYGLGSSSLAKELGVSENIAIEIKNRIYTVFSTALKWIVEKQEIAKSGDVIKDYFGRPRRFDPGEAYRVRNFIVQSVAATVCQEKLVDLWKGLCNTSSYLAFSVHDGYGTICSVESARNTYEIMKNTLETESKLCPGLKMRVEIKFGVDLEDMKVLWKN